MDTKFKEELIGCFKNVKWWNLTWTLEILKIFTLIGSFCPKYIRLDLRKYGGVIFHYTEERCKHWRKSDLWFGKWHEDNDKFLPEHSKVSILGLWWNRFILSRKCMSLKFTEELFVMTMKNDAKFEEELTCRSKIDIRNLGNFDPSTWTSQKYALS